MDRRQFFGACAALVIGPRRQATRPEPFRLVMDGANFIRDSDPVPPADDFYRLNWQPLSQRELLAAQGFSPFEFEVTAP